MGGLLPLARWLFGCNDIAAYKTNGANGVNGFDGRYGANGRCGVYGRDGRMWLIDRWLWWIEGIKLQQCLALKKVDTKVNKNEYKRSTDKEWQEKDKPRSQNGDSAGILSRGAAQPKCAGKEIWDRDGDDEEGGTEDVLSAALTAFDPVGEAVGHKAELITNA